MTLQWVDQIGGHEKLGEKLLKQKKGEKLPTFIPPKVFSDFEATYLACIVQQNFTKFINNITIV